MAHKLLKGLDSLVRTGSSPLRVRPTYQWEGGPGPLHALASSNTPFLTPKSHHWEGVRDFEEYCLGGDSVSRTANTGLINGTPQNRQKSDQLPSTIRRNPTIPSPLRNRPRRPRRYAGAMPRCGYDTTSMRVASNPRQAASTGASCSPRNKKPRGDSNITNRGGSGNGADGKGDNNGRDDDDNGSKKPGHGSKDKGPTTDEDIKTMDDVVIPSLIGRGWTFWL